MANMSYCRFQNTELDLRDCFNALEEAGSVEALEEELGPDELRAFRNLMKLIGYFNEYINPEY